MTTEATPAAPAPAETPAAAPATPAAAVATPETNESLLPAIDQVADAPADPPTPAEPPVETAVNQDAPEWFLSEGVKGEGPVPDWYKADKYKSVGEQAKAYAELEKRLGAFTGAPKDGKYEFNMPEGIDGSLDLEHPLIGSFTEWAKENQMSQGAYTQVLSMLAEYELSLAPDISEVKKQVGENADQRIAAVSSWAKANLKPDEYETVRKATAGANAAEVFKSMEALIAKTRQVRLPPPGREDGDAPVGGEAAINAAQAKLGPDGKRLYETDAHYRAKVEKMRADFYTKAQKVAG